MTWVGVGVAVVGTAGSIYQGNQKRAAQAKYNRGQAEMSRYANLTGNPGHTSFDGSNATGDAIAGLGSGLQQGISARNAFASKPVQPGAQPGMVAGDQMEGMQGTNPATPLQQFDNYQAPMNSPYGRSKYSMIG